MDLIQPSSRNPWIAGLLAAIMGPLGMAYSTALGAVIMFAVSLLLIFFFGGHWYWLTWPVCIAWAVWLRATDELLTIQLLQPVPRSLLPLPCFLHRRRVALGEVALPPVGICGRNGACCIQLRYLLRSEIPADRAQVLLELFLVARTQNH